MQDVTGQKFGRLTAIKFVRWHYFPHSKRQQVWHFICDCGTHTESLLPNVRSRHTNSCGCLLIERRNVARLTHGDAPKGKPTHLYIVWSGMKQRCYDVNCRLYPRWGGRGIKVLWKCYEDFRADMAPSYREGLQIERINNAGDYCKENCKWATAREQALNRRSNLIVTLNGESKPCRLWADETGIKYETLRRRIHAGWSAQTALTTPVGGYRAAL